MINVDINWQSFESLSSVLNVNLFSNISSRWGRVRVIYLLKHQTSEETQDLRSRWHFKMSWVGQSVIGTLDTIDSEEEASFWESDTSPVSRISWMKVSRRRRNSQNIFSRDQSYDGLFLWLWWRGEWRVSPINSCHTLLVSDHGDTISESDNTATTSNNPTLHFTLSSVCSESARCLTYQPKPLSHKISLGGFIYILFSSWARSD